MESIATWIRRIEAPSAYWGGAVFGCLMTVAIFSATLQWGWPAGVLTGAINAVVAYSLNRFC